MSRHSSQSIRYVAREARKASNIFIFPSFLKKLSIAPILSLLWLISAVPVKRNIKLNHFHAWPLLRKKLNFLALISRTHCQPTPSFFKCEFHNLSNTWKVNAGKKKKKNSTEGCGWLWWITHYYNYKTVFHFKGSNTLMLPSLCGCSRLCFNFE